MPILGAWNKIALFYRDKETKNKVYGSRDKNFTRSL